MNFLDDVDKKDVFYIKGQGILNLKGLLTELNSVDDEIFAKYIDENNGLYTWIKNKIKDNKLASQIRNLTLRKNFIKVLELRINFLEKLKLGVEYDMIDISLNTHDKKIVFSVDKEKCFLCDICAKVCPQESIEITKSCHACIKSCSQDIFENSNNIRSIKVDSTSKKKCVLCGFCVPFCPVSALNITIDGKNKNPMEDTEAAIVFNDPIDMNGIKINKFFDGTININNSLCPQNCEDCVSVCPTFALKRENLKLTVDEDLCFYCGACVNACCDNAITVKRSRIIYKNGFCSNFNDAIEKLIGNHYINLNHDNRSINRISGLIQQKDEFIQYNVQANIRKQVPEFESIEKSKNKKVKN